MFHSNIEKGKYLNKSVLQQFFDIDATERVSWKWFYWGITLKKYFDEPDLLILSKVQSLLNQRLDARYFRASSSYSFLRDVPLIAPVIARAALHCMFSFFWQNLSNDLSIVKSLCLWKTSRSFFITLTPFMAWINFFLYVD